MPDEFPPVSYTTVDTGASSDVPVSLQIPLSLERIMVLAAAWVLVVAVVGIVALSVFHRTAPDILTVCVSTVLGGFFSAINMSQKSQSGR